MSSRSWRATRTSPTLSAATAKLPRPSLIAALLSMRNLSQLAMLDGFLASVNDVSTPVRKVSDRSFASARSHLHLPALTSLNDLVVQRADEAGLIDRWRGLRAVAGDASVLMPAVRPCLLSRSAAAPDQHLFTHSSPEHLALL